MVLWHWLGVVGSLAVTGPIGLAILAWLLVGKSWRLAASWVLLFGGGMALVVLTKIAYIGWGLGVASVEFGGFSGHAMRAAAVFPVAGFLVTRSSPPWAQMLGSTTGMVLSVLIAMSRIHTDAHSASEAWTGCVLGLAIAAAFIWCAQGERQLPMSRVLAVLCVPVLLAAPQVKPIPAETWITKVALHLSGHDRPYTRASWRAPKPQLR